MTAKTSSPEPGMTRWRSGSLDSEFRPLQHVGVWLGLVAGLAHWLIGCGGLIRSRIMIDIAA